MWALNGASAASVSLDYSLGTRDLAINFCVFSRLSSLLEALVLPCYNLFLNQYVFEFLRLQSMLWSVLAVFVSSTCAVFYVVVQALHSFLRFGSCIFLPLMLQKLFRQTWNNVHICICQFLYWPIFLLGPSSR